MQTISMTDAKSSTISDSSMESFISDLTRRKTNKFNQLREENFKRNQSVEITNDEQNDLIEEIRKCLDARDDEELEGLIDRQIDKWIDERRFQLPRSIVCEILEYSSR